MIKFNIPSYVGKWNIRNLPWRIKSYGDGSVTKKCHKWLEDKFKAQN